MDNLNWEYDVKCRKCGKITRMHFGPGRMSSTNIKTWIESYGNIPIQKQCDCDEEMMMLHDIVGFGPVNSL